MYRVSYYEVPFVVWYTYTAIFLTLLLFMLYHCKNVSPVSFEICSILHSVSSIIWLIKALTIPAITFSVAPLDLCVRSFVVLVRVCHPLVEPVCLCLCPQKGLKNVFDEAILAALEPPEPKKKRKCVLL